MPTTGITVRSPGSSANVGSGFDAIALALSLHTEVSTTGTGEPEPESALVVRAFRSAGGTGPLWTRSDVPPGKGLGYSGSARAAGIVAALLQDGASVAEARERGYPLVGEGEGHYDNAAAALFGGAVVAANGSVLSLTRTLDVDIVVWVPDNESSTKASRSRLPESVPLGDASFNVARAALLAGALAAGRLEHLAAATEDRLHQSARLAGLPDSSAALEAFLDAGALAAWLSGSGPTIAAFAAPESTPAVVASAPPSGHTKVLALDAEGTVAVEDAAVR